VLEERDSEKRGPSSPKGLRAGSGVAHRERSRAKASAHVQTHGALEKAEEASKEGTSRMMIAIVVAHVAGIAVGWCLHAIYVKRSGGSLGE
jgi:hypothetical protein